jgi:succinate dehydrogenase flavin-adding protein (antitoxin of CptAB toxin-antitoxin module)
MTKGLLQENVPEEFWKLIPLAQKYGLSDDGYRSELLQTINENERLKLKSFLEEYDDKLDSWLAGPEANGPQYSNEYIAFSALRMAADEA